jgi:hypothetical protein
MLYFLCCKFTIEQKRKKNESVCDVFYYKSAKKLVQHIVKMQSNLICRSLQLPESFNIKKNVGFHTIYPTISCQLLNLFKCFLNRLYILEPRFFFFCYTLKISSSSEMIIKKIYSEVMIRISICLTEK